MNVLALVLLLATVLPTGSSKPGGASQVDAAAPTGSCERDDADGGSHKGGGVGQTRADDNYATLVGWLEKGGVEITGVTGRVSSAGGGRGMYATKPLGPGELLFSIPRNFWFSDKTVVCLIVLLSCASTTYHPIPSPGPPPHPVACPSSTRPSPLSPPSSCRVTARCPLHSMVEAGGQHEVDPLPPSAANEHSPTSKPLKDPPPLPLRHG